MPPRLKIFHEVNADLEFLDRRRCFRRDHEAGQDGLPGTSSAVLSASHLARNPILQALHVRIIGFPKFFVRLPL
jgi:hypothetical protein